VQRAPDNKVQNIARRFYTSFTNVTGLTFAGASTHWDAARAMFRT
jgi:hypothetical protein